MATLPLLFLLLSCTRASLEASDVPVDKALRIAIEALYTPDYLALKRKIIREFANAKPGRFGPFVRGVYEDLDTRKKVLAFTFDACSGNHHGYNARLIEFLRKERIPATLFMTGLWIDANPGIFRSLSSDPLFEIENHGLMHRLCSVDGETKYNLIATHNVGDVIDEYTDETAAKVAKQLGMEVVSYDVLSGDAAPFAPAKTIADNILRGSKSGAIVIMHFNHPRWNEEEALRMAIPALRAQGFSFAKLDDSKLKGRQSAKRR